MTCLGFGNYFFGTFTMHYSFNEYIYTYPMHHRSAHKSTSSGTGETDYEDERVYLASISDQPSTGETDSRILPSLVSLYNKEDGYSRHNDKNQRINSILCFLKEKSKELDFDQKVYSILSNPKIRGDSEKEFKFLYDLNLSPEVSRRNAFEIINILKNEFCIPSKDFSIDPISFYFSLSSDKTIATTQLLILAACGISKFEILEKILGNKSAEIYKQRSYNSDVEEARNDFLDLVDNFILKKYDFSTKAGKREVIYDSFAIAKNYQWGIPLPKLFMRDLEQNIEGVFRKEESEKIAQIYIHNFKNSIKGQFNKLNNNIYIETQTD